jgi:zinc transporter ZupT
MAIENPTVFWTKIGFCFIAFIEAFAAGIFPTVNKNCRENPKVLGIANSFAAGVFMGIAFLHILPEETEIWAQCWVDAGHDPDHVLPLPTILVVTGYTIILIIDKVLFDTHSLFADDHGHGGGDGHDHPSKAEDKFRENLRASFATLAQAEQRGNRQSIDKETMNIEAAAKDFLNPQERKAQAIKASFTRAS